MSQKKKRRILQLIGFITGLFFGYIRPYNMQSMLPILGIGVGIGYFIYSAKLADEENSSENTRWFTLIQMIMYFLIGGTLSSSILLALRMMQ
ncbi:MAG: hypothetical protein U5K84_04900 [Alkalibacterium sp.]|nr:hypothetical protein [Alkalibacterium sp.]